MKMLKDIKTWPHKNPKKAQITLTLALVAFISIGVYTWSKASPENNTAQPENIYLAFTGEVYDKIKENYWETIPDENLAELFRLAVEKLTERPTQLETKNKDGVIALVSAHTEALQDDSAKKDFVTQAADLVLANLQPFARSRLYTTLQAQELRKNVANIDESTNLYEVLEVDQDAPQEKIEEAYKEKRAELEKEQTPEAKEHLAQVERAFEALSRQETRQTYDQVGAEPTVVGRKINSSIAYINIKKISPISFDEFQRVAAELDNGATDSLILDLRGNVGGAIDILPYFLGPFIGQGSYGYEFYKQGEHIPFKTVVGWMDSLVRYKKVVVLIDGATQSSAEVIASTLKKYNVGIVAGTPTKGWGTVENTFPIETKLDDKQSYFLFLVHSITLRDDGQPIEGRGVDPLVYITDPNWRNQLYGHIPQQNLVNAVAELIEQ